MRKRIIGSSDSHSGVTYNRAYAIAPRRRPRRPNVLRSFNRTFGRPTEAVPRDVENAVLTSTPNGVHWILVALALTGIASSCAAVTQRVPDVRTQRVRDASPAPDGGRAVGSSLRPPKLIDPVRVEIAPDGSPGVWTFDDDEDYLIEMPDEPVRSGIVLDGGRNVVLIGGEVAIPWQGRDASIASRTGLKILDAIGTVHVEGLLIGGDDLSEGIQIDAPKAKVQIQNVHVSDVHARDQKGFTDNHPDVIQTYGNVRELLVDGLTGSTDYQGLFLHANLGHEPHGPVTLRNVNLIGRPTARFLIWFGTNRGNGDVMLDNVWIDVPSERNGGLGQSVWPSASGSYPERARIRTEADGIHYATWPEEMHPTVIGHVHEGRPRSGDFVDPGAIGIGYRRSEAN